MGTRLKNADKWGLRPNGEGRWVFRVPERPQRKVFIKVGIQVVHGDMDHDNWTVQHIRQGYIVWLSCKGRPAEHFIEGDLVDAMALAAKVIMSPRGVNITTVVTGDK